jgi:hypothetical protein
MHFQVILINPSASGALVNEVVSQTVYRRALSDPMEPCIYRRLQTPDTNSTRSFTYKSFRRPPPWNLKEENTYACIIGYHLLNIKIFRNTAMLLTVSELLDAMNVLMRALKRWKSNLNGVMND